MHREDMIRKIHLTHEWDVIVIGGGATGLWCALDAVTRGYKTLLLEKNDFASATSSKSTKLFHGGLRYLKQGNIDLVWEALRERGRLAKNAPHLFHPLPFLIPYYKTWEKPFYNLGMYLYDFLAGKLGLKKHSFLTREKCLDKCPTLLSKGLKGGCLFYDGQFDDARFAIELAKTIDDHGGVLLNYAEVHTFTKQSGKITGVGIIDHNTGKFIELKAKAIINAGGVFVDEIRKMDDPLSEPVLALSRGSHIVLDRSFLPGSTALIVPKTKDGRIIFVIPWYDKLLVGTTDVPVNALTQGDCIPSEEEIDFLLETAGEYLKKKPRRDDVLSAFAGLRPLVKAKAGKATSKLSRTHKIFTSKSGLITIAGGKWTTARKMAEDTIDKLGKRVCKTKTLPIHQTKSEETIVLAVREELALTLIDVLARRTRVLFLDAAKALEMARPVAIIMAREMNKDDAWIEQQLKEFRLFAVNYLGPGEKLDDYSINYS